MNLGESYSQGKYSPLNVVAASNPVIVLKDEAQEEEAEDVEDGGQAANVTNCQQLFTRPNKLKNVILGMWRVKIKLKQDRPTVGI